MKYVTFLSTDARRTDVDGLVDYSQNLLRKLTGLNSYIFKIIAADHVVLIATKSSLLHLLYSYRVMSRTGQADRQTDGCIIRLDNSSLALSAEQC